MDGLSNHRIGEAFISGGVRDCGEGPEMLVADGRWQWIMRVRFDQNGLSSARVRPFEPHSAFDHALACKDE